MIGLGALVRLFLRDLARRRFVWFLVIISIVAVVVIRWTTGTVEDAVGSGEPYDIATRRAASQLEGLAETLRTLAYVVAMLIAAQIAPESRKNGTAQFVLSLGVSRNALAGAQLSALLLSVTAGVLLLHGGVAIAGLRSEAVTPVEAAAGWVTLLVPLLLVSASAFALSLSSSVVETYLVFFGVPFLTQALPSFTRGGSDAFPGFAMRAIDNLGLLVPWFDHMSPWPHLAFEATSGAPHPEPGWHATHIALATAFWMVLGLWLHRRHDFGSRTAVR